MVTRKLTQTEKILFFLIINAVIFGGIFAAKLLGFTTDSLLILTTAISLEIIYLAFSIQRSMNKTAQTLLDLEKQTANIRENEEKTHTDLIYIGHQMKLIQHELDLLRKGNFLKQNGNSHRILSKNASTFFK